MSASAALPKISFFTNPGSPKRRWQQEASGSLEAADSERKRRDRKASQITGIRLHCLSVSSVLVIKKPTVQILKT